MLPKDFCETIVNEVLEEVKDEFGAHAVGLHILENLEKRWKNEVNRRSKTPIFTNVNSATKLIREENNFSQMLQQKRVKVASPIREPSSELPGFRLSPLPQGRELQFDDDFDLNLPISNPLSGTPLDDKFDSTLEQPAPKKAKTEETEPEISDDDEDDFVVSSKNDVFVQPEVVVPQIRQRSQGGQIAVVPQEVKKKKKAVKKQDLDCEELNSDDDMDEEVPEVDMEQVTNTLICTSEKIKSKGKGEYKWNIQLKSGVLRMNGMDYVFKGGNAKIKW